jgi:uncharacterized protein (DUF1778 family)
MSTFKYDQRMSTALLVRLTPQLHELLKQGADAEESGVCDFIRSAAIHRLATLGLVPVVNEDDE